MWLKLGDGSFLNLSAVSHAWDVADGSFMLQVGAEDSGKSVRLRGEDATNARKALRLEAKQLADRLDTHA